MLLLLKLLMNENRKRTTARSAITAAIWLCGLHCGSVHAYPEFQQFAEKKSGRTTDCATCHTNPTGPVGKGQGQIGSFSEKEIAQLNEARSALQPGQDVDSPILNHFGDLIIKKVGKMKVLQAKEHPEQLVSDYGMDNDLDGDGVPDAQEYLDGTDPLNKYHADAGRIFLVNLVKYAPHLIAAAIGVFLLDFGFARTIRGFEAIKKARKMKSNSN